MPSGSNEFCGPHPDVSHPSTDEFSMGVMEWPHDPDLRAFGLRVNPRRSDANMVKFSVPDLRHNSSHAHNTTNKGQHRQTYIGYAGEAKGYLRKMRLAMHNYVVDPDFDSDDLVGDMAAICKALCTAKHLRDTGEPTGQRAMAPVFDLSKPGKSGYPVNISTSTDFTCFAADTRALLQKMRSTIRHHLGDPKFDMEGVHEELAALSEDMRVRKQKKDTSKPSKKLSPQAVMEIPEPTIDIVDTAEKLQSMIDVVAQVPRPPKSAPLLHLDCEGLDLGRNGSLDMVNMYVPSADKVYLVDVAALKHRAFSTPGHQTDRTLKDVPEDSSIVKGIFDCRGDSDAVYHHYDISLAGVVDIQLLDAAMRQAGQVSGLVGLGRCIGQCLSLSGEDSDRLAALKQWGRWAMESGVAKANEFADIKQLEKGHRNVRFFTAGPDIQGDEVRAGAVSGMVERPISKKVVGYCTAALVLLPALYEYYVSHKYYDSKWESLVKEETERRLELSRSADFDNGKMDMRALPQGWESRLRVDRGQHGNGLVEGMSKGQGGLGL
ncbi:hypothetical protein LTR85_006164 [Meristemomyces frigidus]|nr:hypothetical protein LTR85_006164 [Meristemomyces frigidus]